MLKVERQATIGLSLIYAFRMLGLFMILPVFSVYATGLAGSTPFLIGLTMGIYGLTQVCLQIPLGWASDRLGRKPIIVFGLLLFAVGSVVAAVSTTIYGVMLGRAIQGMGAISSATMALLGDVTTEENRTKAMAAIGATIGLSFALAVVLGPLINQYLGMPGVFYITAGLAVLGIFILYLLVPNKSGWTIHYDSVVTFKSIPRIVFNKTLLPLNVGILIQHAVLTSTFVAIPWQLQHLQVAMQHEWRVMLPMIVIAFGLSLPLILLAEVKRKTKEVFVLSIFLLMITELGCWLLQTHVIGIVLCLGVFFIGFCALEALLPSLVSKEAPAGSRGTAMGFYATSQFLGIFLGGVLAGVISQQYAASYILWANAILLLLWLAVALTMRRPRHLSTRIVPLCVSHVRRENYLAIPGIVDAAVCPDEGVVYLKIDKDIGDPDKLQSELNFLQSSTER